MSICITFIIKISIFKRFDQLKHELSRDSKRWEKTFEFISNAVQKFQKQKLKWIRINFIPWL